MSKEFFLKIIKDNLSFIILLPTLMGGFWQVLELGSMSLSYIRFFSISQMVPDGIIILFIMLLLYLDFIFFKYKLGKRNYRFKIISISAKNRKNENNHYFIRSIESNKLVYIDNPIYKIKKIGISFFAYAFLSFLVYKLYFEVKEDLSLFLLIFFLPFLLLIVFEILETFFVFCLYLYKNEYLETFFKNIFFREFFKVVAMTFLQSMIIFIIAGGVMITRHFHKIYFIPNNLENIAKIKENYYANNQDSIRYFNDKYIFIEHKKEDNSTTIQVVPFGELFDSK